MTIDSCKSAYTPKVDFLLVPSTFAEIILVVFSLEFSLTISIKFYFFTYLSVKTLILKSCNYAYFESYVSKRRETSGLAIAERINELKSSTI